MIAPAGKVLSVFAASMLIAIIIIITIHPSPHH